MAAQRITPGQFGVLVLIVTNPGLSQSALVAAMGTVSEAEAQQVRAWLDERGLTFDTGPDDMWETVIRRMGADPSFLQPGGTGAVH